jgi:rod shape determining protein RodA
VRKARLKNRFYFDWSLVVVPVLLAVSSLATLYSITSISGRTDLVVTQGIYFIISFVAYFLFSAMDYRVLKPLGWYLYILGVILLILVEIIGKSEFGSSRWIEFGFFRLQPSELMKFLYIIFASSYFANMQKFNLKSVLIFILLTLIPVALIFLEPDLGTTLVVSASLVTILIAVKPPAKFYYAAIALVLILSPIAWSGLKPYQKQRITSFINPENDPKNTGYNVIQSKIAVGSGGLYGKGFSGATQSQLSFLPVAHIDFIFSGWAEATGFVGSIALVFVYCFLLFRIFVIANLSRDRFGQIYATALGGLMSFQIMVNIGMNIGVAPVTGIPLPLFSYGGTSLIVVSIMIGVAQSIYLRRKGLTFE